MATIIAWGESIITKNLTLSPSTDTQVGFAQAVNAVSIKCRTAVDIQVRSSQGATEYFTIPSGSTYTFQLFPQGQENGVMLPTNIWLRSGSGTVVVEILGYYGG